MIKPLNRVLEAENSARIDSFVQDQVNRLLKRTRSQAEFDVRVDVQQASP